MSASKPTQTRQWVEQWLDSHCSPNDNRPLVEQALLAGIEFRKRQTFKLLPQELVEIVRGSKQSRWLNIPNQPNGIIKTTGDYRKTGAYQTRCRCCGEPIQCGQEVRRFRWMKHRDDPARGGFTGSLHLNHDDCKGDNSADVLSPSTESGVLSSS